MEVLITLAVVGIPMILLIRYLTKKAEKEKIYYTPEQLKEMEEQAHIQKDSNNPADICSLAYLAHHRHKDRDHYRDID